MQEGQDIITRVNSAKEDLSLADQLIRDYLPFIRAEASKSISRICTEQDDEYSIAMLAFYEAIRGYDEAKGAFFGFAALVIRSRILDYIRKEARHAGQVSLDASEEEGGLSIRDGLRDERDHIEESIGLEATKKEIEELEKVLNGFGIRFSDVADNSPKQERTLSVCQEVIAYAIRDRQLMKEIERTGKLPILRLAAAVKAEKKTLERHRRYLLAMLLIYTNGYEIIRGHLRHLPAGKGGTAT